VFIAPSCAALKDEMSVFVRMPIEVVVSAAIWAVERAETGIATILVFTSDILSPVGKR
jgi:hypothetical protein